MPADTKTPIKLPSGAALVVGSGASGAQIAEERCVPAAASSSRFGRHSRLPRRYRGAI